MTIDQKFSWTKIGVGLSIVVSAYGLFTHLYGDYNNAQQAKIDSATKAALRQAEWNQYRMDVEKRLEAVERSCPAMCVDSIKDAINELDAKTHLKPKF